MKKTVVILAILAAATLARGQATALNGTFRVWPQLTHSKAIGTGLVTETIDTIVVQAITFGTNANQMSKWASKAGTLTNGESVTFSLLGGVSNAFGDALTFDRVNWLSVSAPTGNVSALAVGDAASNPFVGWASGTATVRPGGIVCAFAPDATGYPVNAGTNAIKIANTGTNTETYYLYIGGR